MKGRSFSCVIVIGGGSCAVLYMAGLSKAIYDFELKAQGDEPYSWGPYNGQPPSKDPHE